MNDQLRNALWYVLYAAAGALVATGLQLATALAGTDPILWRPLAATFTTSFFGALATAFGASFRPRVGSENLSRQVNNLRALGISRTEMKVLPKDHTSV